MYVFFQGISKSHILHLRYAFQHSLPYIVFVLIHLIAYILIPEFYYDGACSLKVNSMEPKMMFQKKLPSKLLVPTVNPISLISFQNAFVAHREVDMQGSSSTCSGDKEESTL